MTGAQFTALTSRVVVIPTPNIDTDQIVPARFLKVTEKGGLAAALFADWRGRPGFPLDAADAAGAQVLVAGDNFGCGSSREHAPWALAAAGFRAVVSTSFADIFRNNALKNGIVPVVVDAATWQRLVDLRAADPTAEVTVDLEAEQLRFPGGAVGFTIDPFARRCLLDGVDELGYILAREAAIAAHEARLAAGSPS